MRRSVLTILALSLLPRTALAHIKWLASFDMEGAARSPLETFGQAEFIALALLAALVMWGAAMLDVRLQRWRFVRRMLRPPAYWVDRNSADVLRVGIALSLVAMVGLFWDRPVYLTPELSTNARWVPVLQLAAAATLLQRSAAWYGGVVLLVLYGAAVGEFGWFHLADYPIFVGIAVALILSCAPRYHVRKWSLDVLRLTTALTFMWGGIEKFCFPQWSYPVLEAHPELLLGFSPTVWMMAAGWIEFCAAFALLVFRVGAQVAALLLLVVVMSAIPLFGTVDAVGHAPILVTLLILAATPRNRIAPRGQWAPRLTIHGARVAVVTLVALTSLFMLYVGMHGLRNIDGRTMVEHARALAADRS